MRTALQRFHHSGPKTSQLPGAQWAQRASLAVAVGDLASAAECLRALIRYESKVAQHRFNLAVVLESLGDRAGAAEALTIALRLDPSMHDAARRLSELFGRGVIRERRPTLDARGIAAALACFNVDRDLIAASVLHEISLTKPFQRAFSMAPEIGWIAVARQLVHERAQVLSTPMFIEALQAGVVGRRDFEALLTAIRYVLLTECRGRRFKPDAFGMFVVALLRQCWLNEFVWFETEIEIETLEKLRPEPAAILSGDPAACTEFLLRSLYRPPEDSLGGSLDGLSLERIAHVPFRTVLQSRQADMAEIATMAASLPQLSPVTDVTSLAVAGQYEASPYPRWTSVPLYPAGRYLEHLATYVGSERLAFARSPFEVLIAGCGTGRQAVSAAFDYGPNARVISFDIARASLGYAAMMAKRVRATNLTLALGDLNRVLEFAPSFEGRFSIIECSGVLHHLADPFAAWQKLLQCLAPGGMMLVGLYSSTARRHLPNLKAVADYPGSAADMPALRRYRKSLLDRGSDWPGVELTRGRDFYSASGFRDFFLHVNEHTTTLEEIERFLAANGLRFCGFVSPPIEALRTLYSNEVAPGSLARWSEWERRNPDAFAGMYQFVCVRR